MQHQTVCFCSLSSQNQQNIHERLTHQFFFANDMLGLVTCNIYLSFFFFFSFFLLLLSKLQLFYIAVCLGRQTKKGQTFLESLLQLPDVHTRPNLNFKLETQYTQYCQYI